MRPLTLNQNRDFRRAYTRGKVYANPALVTYVVKNRAGLCRMGITTGKKIGNAVQRNRARRVIRAAAERLPEINAHVDLVFVARSKTPFKKSQEIYAIMAKQLIAAGVIRHEEDRN